MNMLEAARETLALARESNLPNCEFDESPELNYAHLHEMVKKMETGEFSEGKMGRWLGWIQAAVVYMSLSLDEPITLEQMKEINRRWN